MDQILLLTILYIVCYLIVDEVANSIWDLISSLIKFLEHKDDIGQINQIDADILYFKMRNGREIRAYMDKFIEVKARNNESKAMVQ